MISSPMYKENPGVTKDIVLNVNLIASILLILIQYELVTIFFRVASFKIKRDEEYRKAETLEVQ